MTLKEVLIKERANANSDIYHCDRVDVHPYRFIHSEKEYLVDLYDADDIPEWFLYWEVDKYGLERFDDVVAFVIDIFRITDKPFCKYFSADELGMETTALFSALNDYWLSVLYVQKNESGDLFYGKFIGEYNIKTFSSEESTIQFFKDNSNSGRFFGSFETISDVRESMTADGAIPTIPNSITSEDFSTYFCDDGGDYDVGEEFDIVKESIGFYTLSINLVETIAFSTRVLEVCKGESQSVFVTVPCGPCRDDNQLDYAACIANAMIWYRNYPTAKAYCEASGESDVNFNLARGVYTNMCKLWTKHAINAFCDAFGEYF